MSNKVLPCLLLLFSLLLSCTVSTREPDAEALPDLLLSADLSNLNVQSITQDSAGYIWFATYRGLNRFDGREMHQYFSTDDSTSLPDNQTWDLLTDHRGRLWVTTKAGVARYTEQDNFKTIPTDAGHLMTYRLVESRSGLIFMLHASSLLRHDEQADSFRTVLPQLPTTSHYMRINCMTDDADRLWLVDEHHAWVYDAQTLQLRDTLQFPDFEVTHSTLRGDWLWLTSQNEVRIFDTRMMQWGKPLTSINNHPLMRQGTINVIYQPTDRHLLIGTTEGIFSYDIPNQEITHQDDVEFIFNAPNYPISCCYFDRDRNLWLGSSTHGFTVTSPRHRQFNTDKVLRSYFQDQPVSAIHPDHDGHLWICVTDNTIYRYDLSSHQIQQFRLPASVEDFCIDAHGDLWLCSIQQGVIHASLQGDQLRVLGTYPAVMPITVRFDQQGILWVGCYNNVFYSLHPGETQLREHRLFSNTFTYLATILPLRDGTTVTSTKDVALRYIDTARMELGPQLIADSTLQRVLRHGTFLPTDMIEDHQGDLWIGTISNGLLHYDRQSGQLRTIAGAPCLDIASLQEAPDGDIWVSTKYGLGRYDISHHTFINYYRTDGIGGNEFIDRSSCSLPDGTILFGGNHGITHMRPRQSSLSPRPRLLLKDLMVNNQLIRPGQGQPITESLTTAREIQLDHHQQSFSISFAALDYSDVVRYEYQYKLEGFDQDWVGATHTRYAYFANLESGSYQFHVRLIDREHEHPVTELSIPVQILPAPWLSLWARLLYILLLGGIIVYVWQAWYSARRERRNRLITEREREHERRINRMNMNFFANVSHEFRAPLTIISGPVSQLVRDPELSTPHRDLLIIVQRSVNRMLRLVNQMMDFHKLEDDALRLEVQRLDVIQILRHAAEPFQLQAGEKRQVLTLYGLEDVCLQWVDADKLEKIVYNLLGNATKYTPVGGRIDFSFDIVGDQMQIIVADNGDGIPAEQRDRIFDRYYQLNRQVKGEFNWGTGIGLYYTRKLVQMHHGTIQVSAPAEGTGAIFTVLLPTAESAYTEAERNTVTASQGSLYPLESSQPISTIERVDAQAETVGQGLPTLLLIDDDVEIIHYLKTLLSADYNVICRFDAESALEVIDDKAPDLIVCDVMMSGMNGIEFCRQIKSDLQLCHIPVILLTAKVTTSDQITGLNAGADGYVTKPFDPAYLQALITSMLQNREKVRHLLADSTQTEALSENDLSPQDNAFMTDLYALMEKELPNPDLDINHITDMLHISRTKFYYKMKGLTGEKPSAFFKRYKLNRAAELIREGHYNISEISDMTGYNSLSHFSASFKKQFGVSPTEFK